MERSEWNKFRNAFQDTFGQESINNDADSDTTSIVANFDFIPNQQPPKNIQRGIWKWRLTISRGKWEYRYKVENKQWP